MILNIPEGTPTTLGSEGGSGGGGGESETIIPDPPLAVGEWSLVPANAGGMGLEAFYVMEYEAKAWNDSNANNTIEGGEVSATGSGVSLGLHKPVS